MSRKKRKHTTESSKNPQVKKSHPKNSEEWKLKLLNPRVIFIGIFMLTLALRLLYLTQVISTPIAQGLATDSNEYDNFSLQILNGNLTHKDFIYLNPFYPFFLASVYSLFGYSYFAVAIIQTIIDSLSCHIIFYIAATLFRKQVGIIAAFIYACYGIAIFYTGVLLAPTLVIFISLLFIASLLYQRQTERTGQD